MAAQSAAEQVLSTTALCERILASLEPGERRAIGVAACACRGLRDGARAVMTELQRREMPHAAAQGNGASASLLWRTFQAAAAACIPRVAPEGRVWALSSLTFVLELRRADGTLLFTATAKPLSAQGRPRAKLNVGSVKFVGAFASGAAAARFLKTDTASLFVERKKGAAGQPAMRVACLFSNLPRQRIFRYGWGRDDEDASDFGDHTSDEELGDDPESDNEYCDGEYWLPDVTRFEPRTLIFVTPRFALPPTFWEVDANPRAEYHGFYITNDTACTLACAVEEAEDGNAAVSATINFRYGKPHVSEDHGGGENSPLTLLHLTALLKQLEWR